MARIFRRRQKAPGPIDAADSRTQVTNVGLGEITTQEFENPLSGKQEFENPLAGREDFEVPVFDDKGDV